MDNMQLLKKEIEHLTGNNIHTRARLLIARIIGNPKLEKIYTGIQGLQDIEGYLPAGLSDYRNATDKLLKEAGFKQLGNDFNQFWEVL